VIETPRCKLVANLPVELLMQWFGRSTIQPDHFEGHYRMATPFPVKNWRWMFSVRRLAFSSDHEQEHEHELEKEQLSIQSGLAISLQVDC
jgi:hypothetical protein